MLKNGSRNAMRAVPLPAIARKQRAETRPTEKGVEKMLLEMGFKPMDATLKGRLKKSDHWGMPEE